PVYNWEELEKQDFQWWIQRFESILDYVDIIRIDHFRGFEAYWAIPKGEETAINGKWIQAPGERLFSTIRNKIGKLPVLAEDLGFITPEVVELRNHFEFPGMKVLHFAFGSNPDNPFLPFNLPRNCVMYTGTHDNNTTIGWFEQISDYELYNLLTYIGCISPDGVHWDLIRLALTSVADQTIIPLQDIFGLGSQARMNFPGKTEGNWEWRYQQQILIPEISEKLRNLTKLCGRAQQ
ncbi:4-alpha-glucanotransferase, partial [Richelia intracellularis]|uniref:4-alpha-glucanotransferase n=1 Tax=Richelia intracellularis TaxID=1164990 RepID=UPI0005C45B95